MRFFSLVLLLSFVGFSSVLPACAQRKATQTAKKATKKSAASKAATAPAAAGPVLSFERTPCNGTCPAYSMQVYADGRVAYDGGKDVPLVGKQDLRLPAATVAEMLRKAKESRFENFEKSYSSGADDNPSTIVTIRQPSGSLKKVTVEANAPENVQRYFTYLTTQFDQLAQLKGLEK